MHASADSRPGGGPGRAWRARAVFLSSTFADMHAERDYLRLHAFAELEERLRGRCHYLEVVDLRQGVETAAERDESRREARVLQVCLDEIARARPYFVGLLGDRYGWVPPETRTSAAAREAGLDAAADGLSVTELEVLHGVLADPARRGRAWFYLRECDYEGMPAAMRTRFDDRVAADPDAAVRVLRLEALKARLRRELPDRVRTYHVRWDAGTGTMQELDSLSQMVRDDLWVGLDADTQAYVRDAPVSWQDAAVRILDDFVEGRTRLYVDRPAVTDPLLAHLCARAAPDAAWGLCLTGESGSGKSTIFSRIHAELRDRPDLVVLAHAAGIDPHAGSVEAMLRRFAGELARALDVPDPYGDAEHDVPIARASADIDTETIVADLLRRVAASRRVIVLVDALNQFEATTRARYLTWLPREWPANARLLATTLPGTASEALTARPGVREIALAPMTPAEARAVAVRYFRDRHHREPNARALDVLLDARLPDGRFAHGNPLWLELALQEMNLLEADDYARADREFADLPGAERMQALLCQVAARLPSDAPGVYGRLLERAERGFGAAWTRALLGLIAAGRGGWRTRDLRALVPEVCQQPWDELAFAGVRRTIGAHLVQRGAFAQWDVFHAGLRDAILERQHPDPMQRRLLHGVIAQHLQQLRGDPLAESEIMVHYIGMGSQPLAARSLGMSQRYREHVPEARRELAQAVARLAEWLREDVNNEELAGRIGWVAGLTTVWLPDLDLGLAVVRALLFDLDPILEQSGGAAATSIRPLLLDVLHRTVAGFAASEQATPVQQVHAERERSVILGRLGACYLLRERPGDIERAGEAFDASLAIDRHMADRFQDALGFRDLSVTLERCGDFYVRRARTGDLDRALECFEESRAIRERLAAEHPDDAQAWRDLSVSLRKLAGVYARQGDHDRMLGLREAVLARDEQRAARRPDDREALRDVSLSLGDLADALTRRSAPDAADRAVALTRRALDIGRELVGRQPDDAELVRDLAIKLMAAGDAHVDRGGAGDAARARALYEEALAVETRRAAGFFDFDAVRGQAILLSRLGNVSRCDDGGDERSGGEQAWAAYRGAFTRFRVLAEAQPRDAQACRDLVIAHVRLAHAAMMAGRPADVQAHQLELHQLLVRMQAGGLWLDAATEALLAELDRAGVVSATTVVPPSRLARLRAALGLKDD